MVYTISLEKDYLRADLFNRETAEETREVFGQVAVLALRKRCGNVLISVHSSAPVFAAERSGFFERLGVLGVDPSHKIGLLADTSELAYAIGYIERLGHLKGMNV